MSFLKIVALAQVVFAVALFVNMVWGTISTRSFLNVVKDDVVSDNGGKDNSNDGKDDYYYRRAYSKLIRAFLVLAGLFLLQVSFFFTLTK